MTEKEPGIIAEKIITTFGKARVKCIIHHGTSLTQNEFRDIDIYVLLDSYEIFDLVKFQNLKKIFPKCDFSVQWQDEIILSKDRFRMGNQGSYYWNCLGCGLVLYGTHPFSGNCQQELSPLQKSDLLVKVEDYFFRLNSEFFRYPSKDSQSIFVKYILRICLDFLLLNNKISFEEIHSKSNQNLIKKITNSEIFQEETREILKDFFKTSNISMYPKIRECLFRDFLSIKSMQN